MNLIPLQYSVVVLASQHNPSVLNPDFLQLQKVVLPEWNWQLAGHVSLPMFALVRYQNGISIQTEQERLVVTEQRPGLDILKSKVTEIARNYVRVLPHVKYTAVGMNFDVGIPIDAPEDYLTDHFLQDSVRTRLKSSTLLGSGYRLVFHVDARTRLILSLDAGQIGNPKAGDMKPAVIAAGNFHVDIDQKPDSENVNDALGRLKSHLDVFTSVVTKVLEV